MSRSVLDFLRSPITSTSPSNEFVGVDQSITYGSSNGTTILAETAGIADTGTTLLLIASGSPPLLI